MAPEHKISDAEEALEGQSREGQMRPVSGDHAAGRVGRGVVCVGVRPVCGLRCPLRFLEHIHWKAGDSCISIRKEEVPVSGMLATLLSRGRDLVLEFLSPVCPSRLRSL